MPAILFVCTKCDRFKSYPPGNPSGGLELIRALTREVEKSGARPITLRSVECLGGCPQPCCAALRAHGKTQIRISQLTGADAADLLSLARTYFGNAEGVIGREEIPPALRNKLKSWTLPQTESKIDQ